MICSSGTLPTAAATKRQVPKGGVARPMTTFKTKITPKWSGSIPNCTATGAKIGAKIRMFGTESIIQPSISKKMFIKRSTIKGSAVIMWIKVTILSGILAIATSHPKGLVAATIKRTDAAIGRLFLKLSVISLKLRVL